MNSQQISALVRAAYPKPPEVQDACNDAMLDLYYGPAPAARDDGTPRLGFETACKVARRWLDDEVPAELWIDTDAELVIEHVSAAELDDLDAYERQVYMRLDARDIRRHLVGAELARHL